MISWSVKFLHDMILALPMLNLHKYDVIMYTAMFSWAYFGSLRVSKYALGGLSQHTPMLDDIDFAGSLA